MFSARFAVFARRARVLPSPSQLRHCRLHGGSPNILRCNTPIRNKKKGTLRLHIIRTRINIADHSFQHSKQVLIVLYFISLSNQNNHVHYLCTYLLSTHGAHARFTVNATCLCRSTLLSTSTCSSSIYQPKFFLQHHH